MCVNCAFEVFRATFDREGTRGRRLAMRPGNLEGVNLKLTPLAFGITAEQVESISVASLGLRAYMRV